MPNNWIIGADASNGVHNYSGLKRRKDGTYQRRKDLTLTAIRGRASTGDVSAIGVKDTADEFTRYHWHNMQYTAGDDALEHAIGRVQQVSGRQRYGSEAQLFLIATALLQMGVRDGDRVKLCLLAPPGDANEKTAQQYRDGFERFGDCLEISENDGKTHRIHIDEVMVFPETIAASMAMRFDDAGQYQRENNPMRGAIMIIDGGRVTMDRLVFRNGKLDALTVKDATDERLGIGSMILRPAAEWVRDNMPTVYHNGAEELIDRAIRNPRKNKSGVKTYYLSRMGEPTTSAAHAAIAQAIDTYLSSVQSYISAELIETNANRVLVAGGLAYLADGRFSQRFNGRAEFIDLSQYPQTKNVEAAYLNSVGAMRVLLKKQL